VNYKIGACGNTANSRLRPNSAPSIYFLVPVLLCTHLPVPPSWIHSTTKTKPNEFNYPRVHDKMHMYTNDKHAIQGMRWWGGSNPYVTACPGNQIIHELRQSETHCERYVCKAFGKMVAHWIPEAEDCCKTCWKA